MRPRLGIGIVFVLTFVILVLSAPAAILERLALPSNPVKVAGCSGWLWGAGSCRIFMKSQSGWLPAGAISYMWRVSRDSGVHLALDHDGRRAGTIHPSFVGWTARGLEVRLPMLPIGVLPKHISDPWQPTGRFAITVPLVSCGWDTGECAGKGRIQIDNLCAGKAGSLLGNYLMDIEIRHGGSIQGQLTTPSGPLMLQGMFEKSPGQQTRIVGRATVGSEIGDDIRQLLGAIARPDGANSFIYPRPP